MTNHTFIAFLRGVMPSGKNAVKMADVREVLGNNGFIDVRTWIQSGNIALQTSLDAATTAVQIRQLLQTHLGVDLATVIKTKEQLQAVLDGNPFNQDEYDLKRVFFTLCNQPLADTADLIGQDFGEEKLCICEQAAYMYIPTDASRSKLSNVFLEKKLGVSLTTRNFNTISKMITF